MTSSLRLYALIAASTLALSLPARAVDSPSPMADKPKAETAAPKTDGKAAKKKKASKKDEKKSEMQFIDGYKAAYAMIYTQHDYAGGIAKLRSLQQDDHPDVANLIGFSSRKLGRYDDAKLWYEKALAADPRHARTWSYYGMWHAEQGNLLKARDYLTQVASICGTDCREYVELKEVIEGTRVY